MRMTPPGVFTSVTAAAALLVLLLLLGASGPRPSSAASSESGLTSGSFKENYGAPSGYAAITGSNTVWVTTTATPALIVNASYNNDLFRDLQGRAIGSLGESTLLPDCQTSSVGHTTTNPDGSTTTPTITSVTRSDTTAAQTSSNTSFHDSFGRGGHEDTGNESRWRRFHHEPLPLPDQFMARFLDTLMYLAEIITADAISALLFGRWRPPYYQRARRNRFNRRRRRRFRRFRMNAADVVRRIWDACFRLHENMRLGQDDASGPTYQMISNLQLTEYPATLSTFTDVPASEVLATVASAECSALVSIASITAPTLASADLPLLAPRGALPEATTLNLRPRISPRQLLLLEASEMSAVASCYPRVSLPDAGLEIALRPAVSPRSPLLLVAAPLPMGPPSLAPSQCLPEAADENNANSPIFDTSNMEKEGLAVLDVNLLLEGLSSPCPTTSPATPNNRSTLVAADINPGNAEGMVNTLVRHNTAQRSVATAVEAFDRQADTADEPLPSPFFVSEHYTPDSTCYVSAHGVAYTTIIMSYTHQFDHPTKGDTQEATPTTTQTADVSDILWPASNAQMRCKWSQARVQTASSEFYRSSVEAVFASRFIPDDVELAVLSDLVRKHL